LRRAIDTRSWRVPPIFEILQDNGKVIARKMYQVFDMGIGMVAIVSPKDAEDVAGRFRAKQIGRIDADQGRRINVLGRHRSPFGVFQKRPTFKMEKRQLGKTDSRSLSWASERPK